MPEIAIAYQDCQAGKNAVKRPRQEKMPKDITE